MNKTEIDTWIDVLLTKYSQDKIPLKFYYSVNKNVSCPLAIQISGSWANWEPTLVFSWNWIYLSMLGAVKKGKKLLEELRSSGQVHRHRLLGSRRWVGYIQETPRLLLNFSNANSIVGCGVKTKDLLENKGVTREPNNRTCLDLT